jgi:hypothetical protein
MQNPAKLLISWLYRILIFIKCQTWEYTRKVEYCQYQIRKMLAAQADVNCKSKLHPGRSDPTGELSITLRVFDNLQYA